MDGISGSYGSTSTDEMLRRAMEDTGDHDPSTLKADTGRDLHFDVTTSENVHREGLRSNSAALSNATDALVDKARDQAIEKAADLAAKAMPGLGALGPIGTAVVGLGALYKAGIEEPAREGEKQRALGASDAGVVGLAQTLDVEPAFRAYVAQSHNGSSNAAAAIGVTLNGADHAGQRAELQQRADRGLVDAAGYAKLAAKATAPLRQQANEKMHEARATTDPQEASRLMSESYDLSREIAHLQTQYLAPVMGKAGQDAAYGLGVQRAIFLSSTPAQLDAATAKAASHLSAGGQ